ncbi:ComEA family DNA-binding protein [Oceanimonas baumannii]|uniref:Competence protein ComEA n=1 Tax=Oceanimonas baumannii TaxID=129578 RepID=A0A235CQD3_9GAMM|nr:helix-hairpin-helix domain-containing protein [Oceanimonas baumannii]MCC4263721.1 helix-hairpin-helix domain-containing protein [Oceanimonas baumannii]OYD26065.1 competence protein ComEA [Oceanimonas baumannii]TDW62291.1 competence protein ComEA [Oceanimonas baumannii]
MKKILIPSLLSILIATGAPAFASETNTESAVVTSININTASAEQLAQLSGVGPAKADAIVQYRDANGPFKSVDDLAQVRGIGEATVEKNRHLLSN